MKVKLDEHIPVRLAAELANLGHEVDPVASDGLKADPTATLRNAAKHKKIPDYE